MEPLDALKLFTSLWDQLTHAPSHLLVLVGLLAIGMLLKKSPVPNRFIPWVLVTLGAGGYPFFASVGNVDPSFPHPSLVLVVYGGLLAVGSVIAHATLKRSAWFRRAEDAMVKSYNGDTEIIKRTTPPLVLALLLMGCAQVRVPTNTLRFKSAHGQLDIEHPQDFTGTNLVVEIETNGTVRASFGYVHTSNSPEVIDKAARGQVAIIKAQGEAMERSFKAGAEVVGTLGGTAFKAAK